MNFDADHILTALFSGGGGGLGGFIVGLWRAKHIKTKIKSEVMSEIRTEVSAKIDAAKIALAEKVDNGVREIEEKLDETAGAFDETLKGLRQKINDVQLGTEQDFVRKDGFDRFLGEYREDRKEQREDMRALHGKIDQLAIGSR